MCFNESIQMSATAGRSTSLPATLITNHQDHEGTTRKREKKPSIRFIIVVNRDHEDLQNGYSIFSLPRNDS